MAGWLPRRKRPGNDRRSTRRKQEGKGGLQEGSKKSGRHLPANGKPKNNQKTNILSQQQLILIKRSEMGRRLQGGKWRPDLSKADTLDGNVGNNCPTSEGRIRSHAERHKLNQDTPHRPEKKETAGRDHSGRSHENGKGATPAVSEKVHSILFMGKGKTITNPSGVARRTQNPSHDKTGSSTKSRERTPCRVSLEEGVQRFSLGIKGEGYLEKTKVPAGKGLIPDDLKSQTR